VENLLNMFRLESGIVKLAKDWCDISELISNVQHQLRDYSKDHFMRVNICENIPLFFIDYGLISQCLYNLVYNALIYTPLNRSVTISATQYKENLVLVVEDNGNRFSESEMNKVFEKFYRVRNSGIGGTGLGLSIVKGFIESHNGTIRLENNEDGGAKFTILIPAETALNNKFKND
jgi:two-component system, OmpR family, sensor histidine kinase KdpD